MGKVEYVWGCGLKQNGHFTQDGEKWKASIKYGKVSRFSSPSGHLMEVQGMAAETWTREKALTPSQTFSLYVNGPFVPPRAKIIHSQTNKDSGREKKIIVGNCHGIFLKAGESVYKAD